MRTLAEIHGELPVAPETGLTEAQAAQSRQRFGANRLTPLPREPLWKKFLEKFDEPIIKILLAAALLSMIVDLFKPPFDGFRFTVGGIAVGIVALAIAAAYVFKHGDVVPSMLFGAALVLFPIGVATGHASYDGLAVMVAVILATGVAFISEYKSDKEFEILNAQKESLQSKVLRNAEIHALPLEEVVVGDVVLLETGDEIPADGRIVKASDLYIDQSLMTGESEPVRKQARPDDAADGPDQPGCVYRGTQVVDGIGQMFVTEVGDATYLGQIARRLSSEEEDEEEGPENEQKRVKRKLTVSKELTPLQLKLTHLADLISKVGYIAAIAIFLALLVRGLIVGEVRWPKSGATTLTVKGFNSPVTHVAFSPDGTTLAMGSWAMPKGDLTGEVKLWDVSTNKELRTLHGHTDLLSSIAFSADGHTLATGAKDGTINVWDVATGKRKQSFPEGPPALDNKDTDGHYRPITHVALNRDGSLVVSASVDGTVRVGAVATGKVIRTFKGHSGEVINVALSEDGNWAVSAGEDNLVLLWRTDTGAIEKEFRADDFSPKQVAVNADGSQVAVLYVKDGVTSLRSGNATGLNEPWNVGNIGAPVGLQFIERGKKLLAVGSSDRAVLDAHSGLGSIDSKPASADIVAYAPNGTTSARVSNDNTVIVRDTEDDFAAVLLNSASNLLGYFMYMVIIIVVAVPEGLPMSVTVSLALAMRKMTRANSLVRQLVACETIGSATVICSDKTGTLTQNRMRVVRLFHGSKTSERGNPDWPAQIAECQLTNEKTRSVLCTPVSWIALNAAVNSTAHIEAKEGQLVTIGNSTEGALLQWLHEGKLEYAKLRLEYEPLYQIHFSSERKRMTTVVHTGDRLVALVKGAPEWVLEQSTHYLTDDGEAKPWTSAARAEVETELRQAASQAMRTLAFGHALLPPDHASDEDSLHAARESLEKGLIFAGFVAIRDPLRDDVQEAIAECRRAGIDVKMVTGDNLETARAIGAEIGLLERPDAVVLTSNEFNEMSDGQVKECLPRLSILARARPLDKFRMVKLLQEQGEVVAVTGDGTNDAPALKKADVGLAMGKAGTEVAKEASKIVLLDDAFSTIVKAVHWGRSLYENIQRFIQFQLTINVSALVIAFLGPFFGVRPPFTILQLLWINVIMDTLASIALCSEPPRPGLMRQPPKRKDDNILTPAMVRTILSTAVFFIVVMMVLLLGLENGWWLNDSSGVRSKTFPELTYWQVSVFFTVYVFFQVWNEINCRSLTPEQSGLTGVLRNPVFLSIVLLIVLGQVIIVTFGGEVFEVAPLGPLAWLAIAAFTSTVLIYAEIARRVRLQMAKRGTSLP